MLAAPRIMFFESPLLTVAVVLGALLAGLCAGSLVHGVAWRITHGGSAIELVPSCRWCGHTLSLHEAMPFFGWFSRQGVCPYCGTELGYDEPVSAVVSALVFGSIVLRHGMSLQTMELLALACVLLVASLATLWDYCVPNGCILAAVLIRIGYLAALAVSGEDVLDIAIASVVGVFALGVPLALAVFLSNAMLARDVTGIGTVKLVAVVGFYLGWQQGLFAMAVAFALITLVWVLSPSKLLDVEVEGGAHRKTPEEAQELLALARNSKATREEDIAEPMRLIPFSPSIAIALWIMLLLGVTPAIWSSPLF